MSTADNSVPVSPGWGMVPRWIGTVAGRVDPPPRRFCWNDATAGTIITKPFITWQDHSWHPKQLDKVKYETILATFPYPSFVTWYTRHVMV